MGGEMERARMKRMSWTESANQLRPMKQLQRPMRTHSTSASPTVEPVRYERSVHKLNDLV